MELFYLLGFIGIGILIVLFFLENYSDKRFHKEVQDKYDLYNDIYDVKGFKEII